MAATMAGAMDEKKAARTVVLMAAERAEKLVEVTVGCTVDWSVACWDEIAAAY